MYASSASYVDDWLPFTFFVFAVVAVPRFFEYQLWSLPCVYHRVVLVLHTCLLYSALKPVLRLRDLCVALLPFVAWCFVYFFLRLWCRGCTLFLRISVLIPSMCVSPCCPKPKAVTAWSLIFLRTLPCLKCSICTCLSILSRVALFTSYVLFFPCVQCSCVSSLPCVCQIRMVYPNIFATFVQVCACACKNAWRCRYET